MHGILKHAIWITALALVGPLAGSAFASDDMLARLEVLIREQAELIEAQGQRLAEQDRRLAEQEERMEWLATRVRSMRGRRTILFGENERENTAMPRVGGSDGIVCAAGDEGAHGWEPAGSVQHRGVLHIRRLALVLCRERVLHEASDRRPAGDVR